MFAADFVVEICPLLRMKCADVLWIWRRSNSPFFSVRGKEGKIEHLKSSDFSLNQNNDLNFSVVLLGSRESGGPKEYMLF